MRDPFQPHTIENGDTSAAYEGLLYTVFQQLRESNPKGLVIAFTSANSGEGVTYSMQAVINGLAKDTKSQILEVDARRLRALTVSPPELRGFCIPQDDRVCEFNIRQRDGAFYADYSRHDGARFSLDSTPDAGEYSWEGNWQYRRDCVQQLRFGFDYVLIDCPSLKEAGDVLALAPFVDGILNVVEADKTRKDQVLHAEKTIDFARGKLIGHILNKRTYVVPSWLHKRL